MGNGPPSLEGIDEDTALEWAVWGFKQSAEGHNGEYPFSHDDSRIRSELSHRLWEARDDG